MPIYEFACPKCRTIFSFLSKRINPDRKPVCPKCGNKRLSKEISKFAMIKGGQDAADGGPGDGMPDMDDPRVMRAMGELEKDMGRMDENNPQHMAHMMKKMRDIMPEGSIPKELDVAIRRLEKGEDPEKIEQDMGDVLGDFFGDGAGENGGTGGAGYSRDEELYDY